MNWDSIIPLIVKLATSGGVLFLIVDRLLVKRKDKETIIQEQTDAKEKVVQYGVSMVTIYNEIDRIVESKTKPIQEKLDRALDRIDNLEENWVCWKKDCPYRVRNKMDAEIVGIAKDAMNNVCK